MNEVAIFETSEIMTMAKAMGPLFQKKTEDLFALMLIAQAENKHPAIAAQEYDIIQGRPALKSQATLARFQAAGGTIQWLERSDSKVSAKFSHKAGGELTITWTIDRATKAGLTGKDNWKKFPAQMLSARCIAEGVRAVFPACLSGFYLSEEVQDFDDAPRQAQPATTEAPAVEVQATVMDAEAKKAKAEPQAKPQVSVEYLEGRTKILKEVSDIVGAKDSPDAWTEEQKEAIEAKKLAHQSKEAEDLLPLEVLLLRAKIGAKHKGNKNWNDIMLVVREEGLNTEALTKMLEVDNLVEPEQPEMDIY